MASGLLIPMQRSCDLSLEGKFGEVGPSRNLPEMWVLA